MALMNRICPDCGAGIQLDAHAKTGLCPNCGSEINLNEAIQDVQTQAPVDLLRLFSMAKQSYRDNKYQEAADYFQKVLEIDDANYEAHFYLGVSNAYQSSLNNFNVKQAVTGLEKAISIYTGKENTSDNLLDGLKIDYIREMLKMFDAVDLSLEREHYPILQTAIDTYRGTEKIIFSFKDKKGELMYAAKYCCSLLDDPMISRNSDAKNLLILAGKYLFEFSNDVLLNVKVGFAIKIEVQKGNLKDDATANLSLACSTIEKLDPEWKRPPNPPEPACYIATAVYGSYHCPEVKVLRNFRDRTLARHWYGRAFIRIYYSISPTVVTLFGQTRFFNQFWRNVLDRIIRKLEKSDQR